MKIVMIMGSLFLLVFVTTIMFCVFGPLGGMAAFFLIVGVLTSFREERTLEDEEEFIKYPAKPYPYERVGVQDNQAGSPIKPESVRREDSVGP